VTKREIELTEKGKEIYVCLKKIASIVELIKA
jgi:predicted transcriptional regulator